jgi:transposase
MALDLAALPDDVDALHRLIRELAVERAGERKALSEAQAEIERLRLIVQKLQRLQFGRRAERLDGDQLELGLEDLGGDIGRAEELLPAAPEDNQPAARDRSDRPSLPDHLEREDVRLDVEVKTCPCCGEALHAIGETVSEMLDWVPARLRVIRIRRPKYGCRSCGSIHQVPAPDRPIAKGLATSGLLAHVLVSKYCDHLPLYRQSQIFARQGVELDRSTLANWVGGAAWWLEPLRDRLAVQVFGSQKLFADDTPLPVLDPGRGQTKTGRLWVYARDDRPWSGSDPPAAVYFYSPDRRAERPVAHLEQFKGTLQVDGYPGFEQLIPTGVVLAACWAHTRRKFYEVHQATGSPIAAEALRRIGELYAIEDRIRGRSAELRRMVRVELARPVVDALKPWMEAELHRLPPRSGPGRRHPLCPGSVGCPLPLPRGRPDRARHQHRGARHPADRFGPQKPSVRRLRRRRRPLGHCLLADHHRQAQRPRALYLPQGCARAHDKRPSCEPTQRPLALELDAGCLICVRNGRLRHAGTLARWHTGRPGPREEPFRSRPGAVVVTQSCR